MKRLLGIGLVVVLAVTLIIPVGTALAKNNDAHKVTGGGTVEWDGYIDTFGFTAEHIGEDDYAARGQFMAQARDSGFRLKAEIVTLAIDGNKAWMGCIVTQSDIDSFPAGEEFIQLVVDNGKGKNAIIADQMSARIFLPASDVGSMPTADLVEFTNGNFMIH